LLQSWGCDRFDYLVNNAGNSLHASLEKTTEAQFDEIFNPRPGTSKKPPSQQIAASPFQFYDGHLQPGPMSNDDNQDRERNVRDRIATFVQAHKQAKGKQAADEELQTLRRAVGRLDQLLADAAADEQARRKRAEEEEAQALRVAAARLDQLLTDIAKKEAAPELKLRHRARNT
jgi:hypothetical protein